MNNSISKERCLEVDELLYEDNGLHSPMRARRRQSDAKWRASVATCYDTLKRVVPKGQSSSKRKVSKAVILQESERHILHLESILNQLIQTKNQAHGKMVLWKEGQHLTPCSLKHFQDDFAEKQHKIFQSSNQGRRCYNLLDEIKEEIFSMAVDSDQIDLVDNDPVSASKFVDKVSGKEISLFSQPPPSCIKKDCQTTIKSVGKPVMSMSTKHPFNETRAGEDYVASKLLAKYLGRDEQTVPSLESKLLANDTASSEAPSKAVSSLNLNFLESSSSLYRTQEKKADNIHRSSNVFGGKHTPDAAVNDDQTSYAADNDDQEVPSLGSDNPTIKQFCNRDISTDQPSHWNDEENASASFLEQASCFRIASGSLSKWTDFSLQKIKTPKNSVSFQTFRRKLGQNSPSFSPHRDVNKPNNKPATARKLDFSQSYTTRYSTQKDDETENQKEGNHHNHHQPNQYNKTAHSHPISYKSPMLARFTPVKLGPKASGSVTCTQPDEKLVSPWKAFHSPFESKINKRWPVIDPENSLFCFEPVDSILTGDDTDEEKTPAVLSVTDDKGQTQPLGKRKQCNQSLEVLNCKSQPKCRKKLEGLFDPNRAGMEFLVRDGLIEEPQVVPDSDFRVDKRKDQDKTYCQHGNDATDFDGFFFYFCQIGHQLKQQENLSNEEIHSPSIASKVLKMWRRLPSPDKQTIKTLAALETHTGNSGLPDKIGELSQDLVEVDVRPIDLKEFIPTTPV